MHVCSSVPEKLVLNSASAHVSAGTPFSFSSSSTKAATKASTGNEVCGFGIGMYPAVRTRGHQLCYHSTSMAQVLTLAQD